jgi:hypothetical protein
MRDRAGTVCWDASELGFDACVTTKAIWPLARPIVSGSPQVGVFGKHDRPAGITAFAEPSIAFPFVAVGNKVGVLGELNLAAFVFDLRIPSVTFPSWAIAARIRVSIGRHHDRGTPGRGLSMAPLAFPSAAVARIREIRVAWDDNRSA